jgi:hypothetical protein
MKIGDLLIHLSILLGDSKNLEKLWLETHINLKWLSKIEGASLNVKTKGGFYSGLAFIQAKNNPKISYNCPFQESYLKFSVHSVTHSM